MICPKAAISHKILRSPWRQPFWTAIWKCVALQMFRCSGDDSGSGNRLERREFLAPGYLVFHGRGPKMNKYVPSATRFNFKSGVKMSLYFAGKVHGLSGEAG